ncbi:hypothetical protein CN13_02365 [Petrotoga sp. HKA.pet.4.5]|uniref:DNA 3'-5' helicase n=1 Tax=Petrotoga halophila DSM 16923 TaxID=1122953 RepID=A0A2S5EJ80_9BACT|nr:MULTISPECIES: ATP-dependent helicase [Petrotoga]POZ93182.1 hypothetical protein AA81_03145 [Petrotoga halophila DSM 16923]RLL83838.1 hypothetical protein BZ25_05340 [Petrotoga sp. Shatin.DS.tank11.9.2.9.3]RLL90270.1 hypothetical protein CN13_02365 [Petrotoga sp. HKA.pet.4.5]
MLNLSEKQQQIVDFTDGALLVKAGPGSGKTRVLIERIKKLLLTNKRSKILALTFSNLAAEEMKNRLLEDQAVEDYIENVNVGTIHSFCLDIVQSRGNLIGLGTELVLFENNDDRKKMLADIFLKDSELLRLLKSKEKPEVFLNECLELISEQKKNFVSPEVYDGNEAFKEIYIEYNEYLKKQNAIDFDDILFYAYRILTENPNVTKMYTSIYKFICVDEAQDLNFAQYEVIRALCGETFNNIMLVGDENQSIYGFNGSDSNLMSKTFVSNFQPTVYVLNENFRSAKSIVRFANTLEESDSVSNYFYEGELSAHELQDEEEEALFIIKNFKTLMENGHSDIDHPLDFEDFAIIARNRYVLNKVEDKLKDEGIPYYFKKSSSGIEIESEFIKVFDLSLRLLINCKDIIHLRELCKIVKVDVPDTSNSCSGMELLELILKSESHKVIIEELKKFDEVNFEFGKTLKAVADFVENSTEFQEEEKYLIFNDIEMWQKHWSKYIMQVEREYRSAISFRSYIALGKTQDISNDKGVSLLTAHMSKGLQYEVVFVIGLSEGTFPDYRAVRANGKEMEQEKNNMFVAVTRAKRICFLTYPKVKVMPWGDKKNQQASRFIKGLEIRTI